MPDHLRAGGHASLDSFQYQLHVEPGLLGDRKPLGNPRDLDRAHQIVDQLVDRAGADRAEMPDRRRQRRKKRLRALKIGGPGRFTGQVLGRWELGAVLGRGAMGEVYEASHLGTGEPAAVKLLRRELLGDPRHVERFLREVMIARIAPVSEQLILCYVAERVLGLPKSY